MKLQSLRERLAGLYYGWRMIGIVFGLRIALTPLLGSDSVWSLWFFAALYTVLDASMPVTWATVGDFFGRQSFGTIRGNMNLFYTWGGILGPVAAGAVYDRTGSYFAVVIGMMVVLFIAAALTALLIRPWEETRPRTVAI